MVTKLWHWPGRRKGIDMTQGHLRLGKETWNNVKAEVQVKQGGGNESTAVEISEATVTDNTFNVREADGGSYKESGDISSKQIG